MRHTHDAATANPLKVDQHLWFTLTLHGRSGAKASKAGGGDTLEALDQENKGLPVRLVSRLTTEFALMNLRLSLRLVPRRLETSVIAQALIRGALPHLIGAHGPALAAGTPLIGSVSAIARSFNRSPETVRRHVQTLAGQGFFTVERDGVRLTPSPEAGDRVLAYLRCLHDNLLWLVGELHSWGLVVRRAPKTDGGTSLELILRTALDFRLFSVETFRIPIGGYVAMSVWNALSAVSVRHITTDRRLSGLFSGRSTPDTLRRPTTLRALCAVSGLPYSTVWRHVAAMEKAGRAGRKGEGYAILTGQLLTSEIETRVEHHVRNTLDRVNTLAARGLDPAVVPSLYLEGKPVLVPIR